MAVVELRVSVLKLKGASFLFLITLLIFRWVFNSLALIICYFVRELLANRFIFDLWQLRLLNDLLHVVKPNLFPLRSFIHDNFSVRQSD